MDCNKCGSNKFIEFEDRIECAFCGAIYPKDNTNESTEDISNASIPSTNPIEKSFDTVDTSAAEKVATPIAPIFAAKTTLNNGEFDDDENDFDDGVFDDIDTPAAEKVATPIAPIFATKTTFNNGEFSDDEDDFDDGVFDDVDTPVAEEVLTPNAPNFATKTTFNNGEFSDDEDDFDDGVFDEEEPNVVGTLDTINDNDDGIIRNKTTMNIPFEDIEARALELFESGNMSDAFTIIDNTDIDDAKMSNLTYYYIAKCFEDGIGVDANEKMAKTYYRLAEDKAPHGSDYSLGLCYYNLAKRYLEQGDDSATDLYAKAVQYFEQCNDNANAQYYLAEIYFFGYLGARDYDKAFALYSDAAKGGCTKAYSKLGIMYKKGIGTSVDNTNAVECFISGANANDAESLFYLGKCYEKGYASIEQNDENMITCYIRAAELGFDVAECNLGVCYYYGRGVAEDKDKAIELYKSSASKGNKTARYNLAKIDIEHNNDANRGYEELRALADEGFAPARDFLEHSENE